METNCERCTAEIDDNEVQQCPTCKLDGICEECLAEHDCEEGGPHGDD